MLWEIMQEQMATKGHIRIIILKARQLGLSTAVGGYLYNRVSQHPAQKAGVVTHQSKATQTLFEMTKRYHNNCPDHIKPSTKYSSKSELMFDKLDSQYSVATAGGDDILRGEMMNHLHLSEVAFWPANNARTNFNGLTQCVPNNPGTSLFIESTANGMSGVFYETWKGAVEGTNGFYPLFIPWFVDPAYREPVPDTFVRTPDEEEYSALHELDDEQLMFRRLKIGQNGLDLFKQEYPSEPDEAFMTTGRPVFEPQTLSGLLREAPDPIEKLSLFQEEWESSHRGELQVYRMHDAGEQYTIGADVAMGNRNGDYSVAQVLDSKKRHVATWRAHVHPDYFSNVLYALGEYYNWAFLGVEVNNHGLLTCTRLSKDLEYPAFYSDIVYDKEMDTQTERLGFTTSVKSKPLIIDKLRAEVRDGVIKPMDKTTLREMLTYVATETGKYEAEEGSFDDTVMALAIANHIHEGVWETIQNQEDWFQKAV